MMKTLISRSAAVACGTLLSAQIATAAERIFPAAGGDLASIEVWGSDYPSTSDSVKLDQDGTYTASADLSVNALFVTADAATIDFAGTPGRKVTLNGDTGTAGAEAVFADMGEGKTLAIKGGTWYSSTGKGNFRMMADTKMVHTKPSFLTVSDGCVITNINRGVFLALIDDSTATLTGTSVVYSTGTFTGVSNGRRDVVSVCGGSRLYSGSHFYPFDAGCEGCQYGLFGVDTVQKCLGTYYWDTTTNCTCRISNGASGVFKGVRVGVKGKGNRLEIRDPETTVTATSFKIGADKTDGGVGNRMVIANANPENVYGAVYVGYGTGSTDNVLVVSNCTVTGNDIWTIGKEGASGDGNGIAIMEDSSIQNTGKVLNVHQGALYSFDVPENGYSVIPLQFQKFTYTSSNVTFKVNARKYRRAHPNGGRIVLAQANADAWIDTSKTYLRDALAEMNKKSARTGCTFSIVKKQVVCDIGPAPGLILFFR